MKTSLPPWRALRRALCSVLIGTAALGALPRSARAQLYLSQVTPPYGVSEYNVTTGAPINANLVPGLSDPTALAVSGNDLFVLNGSTVGEYNATTGAAINANLVTGLNLPIALAVSGNALFVANQGSNTVGEYNATTGAPINTNLVPGLPFGPLGLAVSGNALFLTTNPGMVGEYNATTGAAINARLLTGLPLGVDALAASGNDLFVSDFGDATVSGYNVTPGGAINGALGYVLYTRPGEPVGLAVSGNALFVVVGYMYPSGTVVGEYNATTGAPINANLITGLRFGPLGLAVGAVPAVPEPSAWWMMAGGGAALLGLLLRKKRRTAQAFFVES